MSLEHLYNKLENMNDLERYAYIQNVFERFQIRPKFDIDELFKDTSGKQSVGKNPLGYIVMHLDKYQLLELIPEYLRELVGGDTFNDTDEYIMSILENTMYLDYYGDYPVVCHDNAAMLRVFEFGVGKYSPWSFLSLNEYTLIPALFRHLYKYYYISKVDEETGLPHLAHAQCNIRMIELIRERNDENAA